MVRGVIVLFLTLGLIIGATVTLLGLLAPFDPSFDIANHFRPFTLGGFVFLLALALVFKLRQWLVPVMIFAAFNAVLTVAPVAFQAGQASTSTVPTTTLKIISFNIWGGNRPLDDIARFLRAEKADFVLLQEIGSRHAAALLPRLKDIYPHQLACAPRRSCDLAMLSRTPWTDARIIEGGLANPALIWARFGNGEDAYRIASLHHAWPFHADAQVSHTDWLIKWRKSVSEPLLIAGDFNLTPFSWKLSKFAWETGLKRYSTFQRSWPGHRYAPAFLIDHVFSSDAFRPIDVRIGPPLGSDHLPIVASVAFDAP